MFLELYVCVNDFVFVDKSVQRIQIVLSTLDRLAYICVTGGNSFNHVYIWEPIYIYIVCIDNE